MLIALMKRIGGGTTLLAGVAVLCLAGNVSPAAAAAGQTDWMDRDNTGGVGDFETTKDLLQIECRIIDGNHTGPVVTNGIVKTGNNIAPAPGHTCSVLPIGTHVGGGVCVNSEALDPSYPCKDMEVRYSWKAGSGSGFNWPAGQTVWFDRDDTSGEGDFETTGDLLEIRCQIVAPPNEVVTNNFVGSTPAPGHTCSVLDVPMPPAVGEPYSGGGVCVNKYALNPKCKDMKVQYYWPKL